MGAAVQIFRFGRVLRHEFQLFEPRKVLATTLSSALPQLSFNYVRTSILRRAGLRIGERSRVMGALRITGHGDWRNLITIGDDTLITGPLHIDLGAPVHIGNRVHLGHDVKLLTADHQIGPSDARCGRLVALPIVIDDGVWIGSRVTLLPGVRVGRGAVVATGAVVTREVGADTLVGGVPARTIRRLSPGDAPSSVRFRNPAMVRLE